MNDIERVFFFNGLKVPMMTKKKAGKGKLDYYTLKKKAYLTVIGFGWRTGVRVWGRRSCGT